MGRHHTAQRQPAPPQRQRWRQLRWRRLQVLFSLTCWDSLRTRVLQTFGVRLSHVVHHSCSSILCLIATATSRGSRRKVRRGQSSTSRAAPAARFQTGQTPAAAAAGLEARPHLRRLSSGGSSALLTLADAQLRMSSPGLPSPTRAPAAGVWQPLPVSRHCRQQAGEFQRRRPQRLGRDPE